MINTDSISPILATDSNQLVESVSPQIIYDTVHTVVSTQQLQLPIESFEKGISLLLLFGFFTLGAIIAVSFYILKKYFSPFIQTVYKIKHIRLYIYRLKIITWLGYLIFISYILLSREFYISLSIGLLLLFIGTFYWKDFFTGIVIKLEGKITKSDVVTFADKTGQIIVFFNRGVHLKTANDDIIFVPYNKLFFASISKKLDKGEMRSRNIQFSLPANNSSNNAEKIASILAICPWIYAHKDAKIERISDTEFSINVYVNDDFSYNKVEEFLVDHLVGM